MLVLLIVSENIIVIFVFIGTSVCSLAGEVNIICSSFSGMPASGLGSMSQSSYTTWSLTLSPLPSEFVSG
jgi:hypothetical protein